MSLCRDALRKLKMPKTIQEEFVRACITAQMPVPLVPDQWQALWTEVGAAFMAMLSIVAFQDQPDDEFGRNASILFKDRSERAYTFTAITDSSSTPRPCTRPNFRNCACPPALERACLPTCAALRQPSLSLVLASDQHRRALTPYTVAHRTCKPALNHA